MGNGSIVGVVHNENRLARVELPSSAGALQRVRHSFPLETATRLDLASRLRSRVRPKKTQPCMRHGAIDFRGHNGSRLASQAS
jgi:hypothetical protein